MIPKIIHYCWFGGEKPNKVKRCIESWKKVLPDYDVREWNAENFDINALRYTKEAFAARKYAFVSDVARVKALYECGGIYLDTDVMVYKSFDSVLDNRCVLGFEEENYVATSFMAAEQGHPLMKQFYDAYADLPFFDADGNIIPGTNVSKLTQMMTERGLIRNDEKQELSDGIVVYPQEYFSPYDYSNCIHHTTQNTICEHLFFVSWMPWTTRAKKMIKHIIGPVLGKDRMNQLRSKIK